MFFRSIESVIPECTVVITGIRIAFIVRQQLILRVDTLSLCSGIEPAIVKKENLFILKIVCSILQKLRLEYLCSVKK